MTKPFLVVGAGPVGMTMASELARYGVPVRIEDKPSSCKTRGCITGGYSSLSSSSLLG